MWYSYLILTGFLAISSVAKQESRILNGNKVDTLRRFPHHVIIRTHMEYSPESRVCSGSIISDSWILTSNKCLAGGSNYDIMFHRTSLSFNNDRSSFVLTVTNSSVFLYPTNYDDLALIQLPIHLIFNEELKPIRLAMDSTRFFNNLVVMPGLNQYDEELSYGMFASVPNQVCKNYYGSEFDEYLQICTIGWRSNNQAACDMDIGGGLIRGWPQEPQLVGLLSNPNCMEGGPAVFTDVTKYTKWMRSVTGQELFMDWYYATYASF